MYAIQCNRQIYGILYACTNGKYFTSYSIRTYHCNVIICPEFQLHFILFINCMPDDDNTRTSAEHIINAIKIT